LCHVPLRVTYGVTLSISDDRAKDKPKRRLAVDGFDNLDT